MVMPLHSSAFVEVRGTRTNHATATLQRQRRLSRSEVDNLVDLVALHTVPADPSNAPRLLRADDPTDDDASDRDGTGRP